MNHYTADFFDTDGRPTPAPPAAAERKLKVWAVLKAVEQGQLSVAEALTAYGISPEELEAHRAGWREFETGSR